MRSNRLEVEVMLDGVIPMRLKESGEVIRDNIKASIAAQGLIDTSQMIDDIQYQPEEPEDKVRVGSTITDPHPDYPYPYLLNNGFKHHITEEIVGPYRFMEKGTSNSEGDLRRIWKEPLG